MGRDYRKKFLENHPPLIGGPYKTPKCHVGGWLESEVSGDAIVRGLTDSPVMWPYTFTPINGRRRLIVCGDLEEAIKVESSRAIQYLFGVSVATVSKWRRALGVEPCNDGTRSIFRANWPHMLGVEGSRAANAKRWSMPRRDWTPDVRRLRAEGLSIEEIGEKLDIGQTLIRRALAPGDPLPWKSPRTGLLVDDQPIETFADRLFHERAKRGWTLSELMNRSGVSRNYISDMEEGESLPTKHIKARLEAAFGCELAEAARVWKSPRTGLPLDQQPLETFADRLFHERARRQWYVSELAEQSGVSAAYIGYLEAGKGEPQPEIVDRLAAGFGIDRATLMPETAEPVEAPTAIWRSPRTGRLLEDQPVETFADRLFHERAKRGWSARELARRAEVSRSYVTNLEKGVSMPTAPVRTRFEAAFGCELKEADCAVPPPKLMSAGPDHASASAPACVSPRTGLPLDEQSLATFSDRLFFERTKRGWSRHELARRSGVSRGSINNYEKCDRMPTDDIKARLEAAFGHELTASGPPVATPPRRPGDYFDSPHRPRDDSRTGVIDEPSIRSFADRLYFERTTRGWSKKELEKRSGVSRCYVVHLEAGKSLPSKETKAKLEAAFGCELKEADHVVWKSRRTGLPVDEQPLEMFADRLFYERAKREWKVSELSEKSGVSTAFITHLEAGKNLPSTEVLGRLMAAFGVDRETLMPDSDVRPPRRPRPRAWRTG